ncbi:RING-H2 finger protein ATL30-like [Panicum miliaceum]|uniref:RING-type E3 ubiquitin transferase n=1 Tax=Panicum miliaceum TaxID=4540 RepID=A0A3L6S2U8_PANMI|nr:RING-H2 finger protein ATL30-like [Panicum miliaceum]
MARHQTNCHWAIELLEAAAIFVAGIATVAVAAVGFLRNGGIAILFLGGRAAVFFFAIGFRVSSAALRNRRSASGLQVEGDEEDGTLPGIAAGGHGPKRHHHRGSIQLPAIVIAQLEELSHNKVGGGGEECAICLCKIGNDGVPTRQLPVCRHVLHRDCIEQWLRVHPTCPICRCKVLSS